MTGILDTTLAFAVVFQAGFVASTVVTVTAMYVRRRPVKRHVLYMMASYLCLTLVIAYNVIRGFVHMPPETAVLALVGFFLGDVGLTQHMSGWMRKRS